MRSRRAVATAIVAQTTGACDEDVFALHISHENQHTKAQNMAEHSVAGGSHSRFDAHFC